MSAALSNIFYTLSFEVFVAGLDYACLIIIISVIEQRSLGLFQAIRLHTYTTIMPISLIFKITIFSNIYEFNDILDRPNVTNVVKNNVKKLSVGQKITDKFGGCVKTVQGQEGRVQRFSVPTFGQRAQRPALLINT